MDVVSNNYMPGDPKLIDHIVYELKAQGIFDNFRKECIADVDTKPAYQNLRQRVEGSVIGFLKAKQWRPDMNKNQVREQLRKEISESGFLETGVERIVDQVVNPKINTIFLPQVENVVYKVLGIQKPSTFDELKAEVVNQKVVPDEKPNTSGNNLLPSDLEAVSPESEPLEKKIDVSNESQKLETSKIDEDESPPFEPLEESTSFMVQEDNSVDSHLSGFSGLASHDSNHSFEVINNKLTPMEISNQDSQFSKQSSDDHLSIVMSDETEMKIEVNEDSTLSKISKTTDSDFLQENQASSDKSSQSSEKKTEDKPKTDEKKTEKHRSSDKHRSRKDSKDRKNEKDRRSDRDKKDHKDKSKYSSKDKGKDRKDSRSDKDRDRSRNSSSKHSSSKDKSASRKESVSKEKSKEESKSKNESSKNRDESKVKSESKSHSSSKSKSHSKHNGKGSSDADKNSSKSKKEDKPKKDDKHQSRSDKHSSSKKDEKHDKRDPKKDTKKVNNKDDHYSLKPKSSNRRSTDRDSSDGHSGTHSSSSSFADSSASSQLQKATQEDSAINSRSNSGDSGNSDQTESVTNAIPEELPQVKLIKPKFASNIYEARKLMKIRRKLGKIEKQNQIELMKQNAALKILKLPPKVDAYIDKLVAAVEASSKNQQPQQIENHKNVKERKNSARADSEEEHLAEVVEVNENDATIATPLQNSVISKESWDAVEAKLLKDVMKTEYSSYVEAHHTDTTIVKPTTKKDNSVIKPTTKKDTSIIKPTTKKDKAATKKDKAATKKGKAATNNKDCLGFSQDINADFARYIEMLQMLTRQLEDDITLKERVLNPVNKPPLDTDNAIINRNLPKIAIVDVTSDSEIVISPRKGVKRLRSDLHNNNNQSTTRLDQDHLADKFVVSKAKLNVLSKAKKAKIIDSSVNHLDTFNLPLSPAESDKSFTTTTTDKKNEKDDSKVKRNSNIKGGANNSSNQRYSTDDLYKPRLQFSSSRRRAAKNKDAN